MMFKNVPLNIVLLDFFLLFGIVEIIKVLIMNLGTKNLFFLFKEGEEILMLLLDRIFKDIIRESSLNSI